MIKLTNGMLYCAKYTHGGIRPQPEIKSGPNTEFFSLCEITYNLRYPGPRGKFTFEITVPPNALGYLPAHIVFKHLTTLASNSLAPGLKGPKESIYLNYRNYKNEKRLDLTG